MEEKQELVNKLAQAQEAHGFFIDIAKRLLSLMGVDHTSDLVATLIMIALSALMSLAIFYLSKFIFIKVVGTIVKRTTVTWDDYLLNNKVLTRAAYVPSISSLMGFGLAMHTDNWLHSLYMHFVYLYMTFMWGRLILALVDSTFDLISSKYPKAQSLKSIKQLITYVIFILMVIIMIAIVIDKNPTALLTGLGASAAIMSLVFKETIQSLVSGIQLSANSMVAVGDWIVVPKASANGVVTEMNLNTVKIRNWDNTITTVPPSTLLSDAFTNWKGMSESAGRRLNRSVCVDMDTVRFVSPDEEAHFAQMPELYYFFERRRKDESGYQDPLTNLTLFREYMVAYLTRNPDILDPNPATRTQLMVRFLQPTQYGMPVELYCFTRTQVWAEHEAVISRLMEHMIAAMGEFGLRAYQVASSKAGKPEQLSAPVSASISALDEHKPEGGAKG